MKKKIEFEAIVRKQPGYEPLGKINSKKLKPFINKKVKVRVEEV